MSVIAHFQGRAVRWFFASNGDGLATVSRSTGYVVYGQGSVSRHAQHQIRATPSLAPRPMTSRSVRVGRQSTDVAGLGESPSTCITVPRVRPDLGLGHGGKALVLTLRRKLALTNIGQV